MSELLVATDMTSEDKGVYMTTSERNVAQGEDKNVEERDVEKELRWWQRGQRTEEQKLVRKLDLFILSWACFGYFVRLLDTSNMSNAYVSGMKEDLNLNGDEYNLFTTYWTIGYCIGMIPSQIIITHIRPSIWIPSSEIVWAIITFCFAAVTYVKQVFAMRFLIGLAESPFYCGAMTLLGNWYTPEELAKRAGIFYSTSFAASMFSGYLQDAVYTDLGGRYGIAGWRWLFLMCGVITVPGAIWGFFAVPDSPYDTRLKFLRPHEVELARGRMVDIGRKPFEGITLKTFGRTLTRPFVLLFIVNYIFFCLDTNALGYFAIYLKALGTYTVQQINLIPTGAYAIGLVATVLFTMASDRLRSRTGIAFVISLINLVAGILLASATSQGVIMAGYMINASTYSYGPVMIPYLNEILSELADERALVLGIAQSVGAAFNAWVPLLIFNTGTQTPLFKAGYITTTVMAGLQALSVLGLARLANAIPSTKV